MAAAAASMCKFALQNNGNFNPGVALGCNSSSISVQPSTMPRAPLAASLWHCSTKNWRVSSRNTLELNSSMMLLGWVQLRSCGHKCMGLIYTSEKLIMMHNFSQTLLFLYASGFKSLTSGKCETCLARSRAPPHADRGARVER